VDANTDIADAVRDHRTRIGTLFVDRGIVDVDRDLDAVRYFADVDWNLADAYMDHMDVGLNLGDADMDLADADRGPVYVIGVLWTWIETLTRIGTLCMRILLDHHTGFC
jgi:hypothetical protein